MNVITVVETPKTLTYADALGMQTVGLAAWQSSMGAARSEAEIRHFYNPDDEEYVRSKEEAYRKIATKGVVCLALDATQNERVAGFLLAQNDASGNIIARALKRKLRPEKEYAWIAQINVHPDYQGQGIGKRLLREGLEHFRGDQVPTAYIFKENELVWKAATKLGFGLSPTDQDPRIMHDYFGEDADPVEQYRFAAPSVSSVLEKL